MTRVPAQEAWQVLKPSIKAKINLRMTLCGGQCFHWYPTPRRTFVGAIGHHVYELREVHCPSRTKQVMTSARQSVQERVGALKSDIQAENVTMLGSSADEVCCWIEYRKLWPPQEQLTRVEAKTTVTNSQSKGRKRGPTTLLSPHLSNTLNSSSSDTCHAEADEVLLTRYLSLDVDLAALWQRWTAAPSTRAHPLVTYLIGNSRDAAAVQTAAVRQGASVPACTHTGGVSTAVYIPIRHVRQDVHSCLFSFLCSQNNNVTRITSMIYRLCRTYGDHLCDVQLATGAVRPPSGEEKADRFVKAERAEQKPTELPKAQGKREKRGLCAQKQPEPIAKNSEWMRVYSFPSIAQLDAATEEKLRSLGFGYRSKYVVDAVKSITETRLSSGRSIAQLVQSLPTLLRQQHQACIHQPFYADLLAHHGDLAYQRAKLMHLCGVGRKVADCVLLFSLAHSNLVPVDTHMAQVAVEYLATRKLASVVVAGSTTTQTRKRRRSVEQKVAESKDNVAAGSGKVTNASWEDELVLWGEKAKQLKAKALKEAAAEKKKNDAKQTKATQVMKAQRGAVALTAESTADEATDTSKLPVPPLYERHHDAIQHGFTQLFGPHAGWAHSILFYYRMRK